MIDFYRNHRNLDRARTANELDPLFFVDFHRASCCISRASKNTLQPNDYLCIVAMILLVFIRLWYYFFAMILFLCFSHCFSVSSTRSAIFTLISIHLLFLLKEEESRSMFIKSIPFLSFRRDESFYFVLSSRRKKSLSTVLSLKNEKCGSRERTERERERGAKEREREGREREERESRERKREKREREESGSERKSLT